MGTSLKALPEITPINMNTASKTVLMSLSNTMSDAQADELIANRGEKIALSKEELAKILRKFAIREELITLTSRYFLSKATVFSDDLSLSNYTVIKRSEDKKKNIAVSIVSENLNSL